MFTTKFDKRVLIINGPNLNLLGIREPDIYGKMTLKELNREIQSYARLRRIHCLFFQSNHEGKIIDAIHKQFNQIDGMVINPGALTHYSYSLRDAISGTSIPTVEVHLSEIKKRESFRKTSVIQSVCIQQISGLGKDSYLKGLDCLVDYWTKKP